MTQHIVFTGDSKFGNGLFNLWTSDGTLAGTHEIKIRGLDPNLQRLGFLAGDFVQLGDKILLTGWDRLGGPEDHGLQSSALWVTDGTSAGTYEIGGDYEAGIKGIGGDNPDSTGQLTEYGLQPSNFVSFGDRVEFFGYDANNTRGIWITDGTAKGTYELGGLGGAGIKGAYFSGLAATNFTAVGDSLIFQGIDKFHHSGLWVTDGTTKGTVEVGGSRNAGIKGAAAGDFNFIKATTVGSQVFFVAQDAGDHAGLWVTDGTAKGTVEIGGLGNAGVAGVTTPGDLAGTPITTFDDKLIFSAAGGIWVSDGTAAGTEKLTSMPWVGSYAVVGGKLWLCNTDGLWETDGTAAGTHQLLSGDEKAIVNAGNTGLDFGDLGSVGDKAVFEGTDASGQRCLWVTDGTAKGTVEIGGLNNHNVKDADAAGLAPFDFVSAGDKAYFSGQDAAGHVFPLWVTDGTVKGTVELDNAAGADSSGLSAHDLTFLPSAITVHIDPSPKIVSDVFHLSGDIVDDVAIKSLKLFDGGKQLASAKVGADRWNVAADLGRGTFNDLKIVATDADGRTDTAKAAFSLVIGAAMDEHLQGTSGRDFILGLKGGDALSGGKGADTFVFTALDDSKVSNTARDSITDFKHAEHDRIDLRLLDAIESKKGDQAFHFVGDHAFKHRAGELHSETTGGNTLISGDVDGNGKADFAILLHGHITLHASDFYL